MFIAASSHPCDASAALLFQHAPCYRDSGYVLSQHGCVIRCLVRGKEELGLKIIKGRVMQFSIAQPGFEGQNIAVETAGFFRGARVMQNGNPVARRKGRYALRSNAGEEVLVKLKSNFVDPVPKVMFGDTAIVLARPLTWYEYVWISLPILLMLTGGGLGALVGIPAIYTSARVFRGDRGSVAKYAITAGVSLVAVVVFVILAIIAQGMIGRAPS